jgi:hypothetical protein
LRQITFGQSGISSWFCQVYAADGDGGGLQQEQPLVDRVAQWGAIAAQQYRADGAADGWDSGPDEEETAEQKYIKVPDQAHDHDNPPLHAGPCCILP